MTRHHWSRKTRSAMVVVLIGAWASLAAVASPATANGGCVPQQLGDAITSFALADTELQGSQTVRIDFAGALPEGSCAGDTVVIKPPTNFPLNDGSTPVLDPDGIQMGTMTVAGNVVTITFNDYVETHSDVTFSGFFWGHLSGSSVDTDYDLVWQVGATTITTPVHTDAACTTCTNVRTSGTKSAGMGKDGRINVQLTTATTKAAGELMTYTDVVGEGQQVDCSTFVGWYGTTYTPYGGLILTNHLPVTVQSCDDNGFTATMTSTAPGQVLDIQVYVNTTEELASYSDTGTITQTGRTDKVHASANNYAVGVQGSGDTPPPPPPPPSDPPTPPAVTPTPPADNPTPPAVTPTPPADDPTPPADDSTLPADDPTPPAVTPTDDPTPTDVPTPPADNPTPTDVPTPPADNPTPTDSTTPAVDTPSTTTRPTDDPTTPQGSTQPPTSGAGSPQVSTPTTLPNTGMGAGTPAMAATGFGLLAAGIFLVATGRRRRVRPS